MSTRAGAQPPRPTLVEGSVRKHLIELTTPMIWGLLALMSFNFIDTWFVAQLGASELAAMSFTFPVVNALISVGIGLMAGTSSVLARVIGEHDVARLRRITSDALVLALLVSALLAAAGIATIDPLFRALGAGDDLLPLITDYMQIWYLSLVLLLAPMAGLGAIRATGDSRLQSRILIGVALINFILDPLLIFGLMGFPRMGLEGAALATLVSRAVMLGAGFYALHTMKGMLSFALPSVHELLASWRRVLHVGLPAAGTNIIIPLSAGFITAMLAAFGPDAVAGFGAATRIEGVSLIVFFAMSSMIGPFVGQNLGAQRYDRVGEAIRLSAKFCLSAGLILALVLGLAAKALAGLFSASPPVIAVCVVYLLMVPVSYGAAGIVMNVNAAFNGLGAPGPAIVISLCRALLVYVPLAYLGGKLFGVNGIFAATTISNLLVGALAYTYYRRFVAELRTRQRERAAQPSRHAQSSST